MMSDTRRAQVMAALGTPNYANETRTDFDDLKPSTVRRRYVDLKDSTRMVKGADDLKHPMAGRSGGVARTAAAPVIPDMKNHAVKDHEDDSLAPHDLRSVAQRDLMTSLVNQLGELDMQTGLQAMAYTQGMTNAGRWTPGKGGNASDWIGRMIKKVRELKAAANDTPAVNVTDDKKFQAIPNGYYAVADTGPDDIHFFRISRFRDGNIKVQEQASDVLHPVRRGGYRTAVLNTILHVGPAEASALYGRTIGRCGRCNRTLTDAESRARGIGPDCWEKM